MCRIERYNLIFPDGHVELRERIVNTCRRGTPSAPCHRREYTQLNRDRFATQADIEEYARNNAITIAPSPYLTQNFQPEPRPEESSLQRRKDHRGALGGLALEFKFWNPFSSKSKKGNKTLNRRRTISDEADIIERMPEAPMPPPAWVPRQGLEPNIVTREPDRKTPKGSTERKTTKTKKASNKKRTEKPILHQGKRPSVSVSGSSNDSSEDERDSPTTGQPIRIHRRPKAEQSPSPAPSAAERAKEAQYRKEKRERDQRNAEAERVARELGRRAHENELRRDRRRIENPERRHIESDQVRRQRVEEEQARQAREDREAFRAQQARERPIARQPRGGRGVTLHQRGSSIEETGQDFLNSAVAEARLRREESEASDATRDGLRRRNTIDGTRRPSSRDGRGRGYDRRRQYGGSG